METTGFSAQLRRSILINSTMGILTIGLTISLVSIAFLYFRIRSELSNSLVHSLRIRTMAVDEFTNRAQDIALQITSRTKIRQKLEEFNRGEITRDELAEFSAPLLADAMRQSREIAGITRLDAEQRPVVSIGLPVPGPAWPIPDASGERVLIRGPLVIDGRSYLVLGAAIISGEDSRVGTDIILFETGKLQNILKDYSGLGKKGETILGIPGGNKIHLLIPLRDSGEGSSSLTPVVLSPASPAAEALKNAISKRKGILSPDSPSIIAYGPLANTDWGLAVRMDKNELYGPMYREVFIMATVIILLLLTGYYVMIVVLRPLTKSIVIKAEDLEKQIRDKTLQLEVSAAALTDEKALLMETNLELQRAYEELKAAQSRILQQEKMASIGQLAAGVAHEINTPLGFIISNLTTLEKYMERFTGFIKVQSEALHGASSKGLKDLDNLCTQVDEMRRLSKLDYITKDTGSLILESLEGAERVKKIVQDLRNFAHIDESEWGDGDINAAIESTVNIIWNELKDRAVVKKKYRDMPPVRCNIGQLNQVFMNILLNAAQSMDSQGEITIETWSDKEYAYIVISDDGCGIKAEDLNRIFEPFFTRKDVGKGTGLGLSIAYDIVKKHKGDIEVCSEVGKGTTFTVKIPVAGTEGR